MRIREADQADIDAIKTVGHRTWPETYGFAGADYVADGLARWWSTEAIEESMRDTTMLVAADDDALLGVGNIDLRGPVPIIWKLYVVPQSQGTGAGSALMAGGHLHNLAGAGDQQRERRRLSVRQGRRGPILRGRL